MTASNFPAAVALIKVYEGGYSNNPKDKGGPTCWGVTLAALEDHRGQVCTALDVRALTWAEAADIYHSTYWPAVKGDILPPGVDLIVFDAAINCGRSAAVKFLQAGLGIVTDGAFGPNTLAVLAATHDRVGLIERIRVARAAYYHSLDDFPTFGAGWLSRLTSVAHTATAWATKAS